MLERGAAWMWFEGFGLLPGSPFNSTTDREVAIAMAKQGFDIMTLVPTRRSEATYRAIIRASLEGEGKQ